MNSNLRSLVGKFWPWPCKLEPVVPPVDPSISPFQIPIHDGNLLAIADLLSQGYLPTAVDLARVVSARSTNRYMGMRDYVFSIDLVRLFRPYLSARNVLDYRAALRHVDGGSRVGLVGNISGAYEVGEVLYAILQESPYRLDFSEAPDTWVGRSVIHGEGLFAGKAFDEGELVADYAASFEKWTRVSYDELHILHDVHARAWFVGESTTHLRVAAKDSVFMRANHRRTPDCNCLWSPTKKTLIAVRSIAVGEELTYDYRLEIGAPDFKSSPPPWA